MSPENGAPSPDLAKLKQADPPPATSPRGVDDPVAPCPLKDLKALEANVVDENKAPVANLRIAVRNGPGQWMKSKTGPDGAARFEGMKEGSYELSLYALDGARWRVLQTVSLEGDAARAHSLAAWEQQESAASASPTSYTVQECDCLASIAYKEGLAPDSIWKDEDNETLVKREDRHEAVLNPDDVLKLPPRRAEWRPVKTGERYLIEIQGVPTVFRAHLDNDEEPRAGMTCMVKIDGEASIQKTGEDGLIEFPIPPDASIIEITVNDLEWFAVDLGALDPASTRSGMEARLYNLGYLLERTEGWPDDMADIAFRAAVRWFQDDFGLDPTGSLDEDEQDLLLEVHGI